MSRRIKVIAFSLIMVLAATLEAGVVPLIQVDNKPDARIEIVPIDDAHRSAMPASLGDASALPPGSFILVNRTATPITAVVVRWTYSDSSGALRQHRLNCDAYLLPPLRPIVKANDLSLITPNGCTAQELFPSLTTGGLLGSPLKALAQGRDSPDPRATMHVYVDSVFFEDGQICGPDKLDYSTEIGIRFAAVMQFVSEVTTARSAGESMPSLLARIHSNAQGTPGKASWLRAYYAGLLQRSPNPEGTLQQLKAQTPPPTFRHMGGL